jgi:tetratricopeptide (TPR) repeat protein
MAVVSGRVGFHAENINVSVELVNVSDGTILWREAYGRPTSEILSLQADISRGISASLRPSLSSDEQHRAARPQTANTEAYKLYLTGRHGWNRRTEDALRSSAEYFQRAIEEDPAFAMAWTGLADSRNLLGSYGVIAPEEIFPRARTAARRAIELDPSLAEAHTSLAWVKYEYEWDWAGAEREFQKAIELSPEYATAHHWYAWLLSTTGRLAEAVESVRRARELDPVSPVIHMQVGVFLYYAHRHEEAVEEARKSIQMDPTFGRAYNWLGSALLQLRRYGEAIAVLEKGLNLSQNGVIETGFLGHAYGAAGRKDDARRLLAELRTMSTKRYVPTGFIAYIHLGLGEHEAAVEELTRTDRPMSSCFLPDPRLDPIRSHPKFKDLLHRMGLAGKQ